VTALAGAGRISIGRGRLFDTHHMRRGGMALALASSGEGVTLVAGAGRMSTSGEGVTLVA